MPDEKMPDGQMPDVTVTMLTSSLQRDRLSIAKLPVTTGPINRMGEHNHAFRHFCLTPTLDLNLGKLNALRSFDQSLRRLRGYQDR